MKLIVGLGNPGEQYKLTRHNIGFIFIDEYLKENNINDIREKFKSEFIQTNFQNEKIFYQKPLTYMNLSGEAIAEAVKFFKIDPKTELFVIYDDMDMKFGKLKIKKEGSAGGHNGIKSIISHIGKDFIPEEKEILKESRKKIFDLIEDIKTNTSVEKLMNKYNSKK